MNLEQRQKLFAQIQKPEGLLAYANSIGETEEAERLRGKLMQLIDSL